LSIALKPSIASILVFKNNLVSIKYRSRSSQRRRLDLPNNCLIGAGKVCGELCASILLKIERLKAVSSILVFNYYLVSISHCTRSSQRKRLDLPNSCLMAGPGSVYGELWDSIIPAKPKIASILVFNNHCVSIHEHLHLFAPSCNTIWRVDTGVDWRKDTAIWSKVACLDWACCRGGTVLIFVKITCVPRIFLHITISVTEHALAPIRLEYHLVPAVIIRIYNDPALLISGRATADGFQRVGLAISAGTGQEPSATKLHWQRIANSVEPLPERIRPRNGGSTIAIQAVRQ
jgi:hypothetical protein